MGRGDVALAPDGHLCAIHIVGVDIKLGLELGDGVKVDHLLGKRQVGAHAQAFAAQVRRRQGGQEQLGHVREKAMAHRRGRVVQRLGERVAVHDPVAVGGGLLARLHEHLEVHRKTVVNGVRNTHFGPVFQRLARVAVFRRSIQQAHQRACARGGNHVKFCAFFQKSHQGAGHQRGVGRAAANQQGFFVFVLRIHLGCHACFLVEGMEKTPRQPRCAPG